MTSSSNSATGRRGGRKSSEARKAFGWRKGIVLALLAAASIALVISFDTRALVRETLEWLRHLGPWGPVLFVLIYIAATVLLIPGSILSLGAGALFGVIRGSLLISLASTLGATCAFLLGRYLARDWVAKKIESHSSFAGIDRAVSSEGWKIVFLTRLSPVLPFTLLNYAFGVTRVSLRAYVLASWLGMMPGTVMYVYLGSLAGEGFAGRQRSPAEWALYVAGLLATVAVVALVTVKARRALVKRTTSNV
jgi:uncharacterized membrane protein YdjX (TVP38/TMEM64 family)